MLIILSFLDALNSHLRMSLSSSTSLSLDSTVLIGDFYFLPSGQSSAGSAIIKNASVSSLQMLSRFLQINPEWFDAKGVS